MTLSKSCLVAATLAILGSVNAHTSMREPKPYGFRTVSSSPLGPELLFPCQMGGRPDAFDRTGVSNPMAVGEPQDLRFTGSAVHGGGSCQLSVTYEDPPPADKSKWRVIHTMIGGCPTNAKGNIPTTGSDDDQRPTGDECAPGEHGECLNTYQFQIPKGMKNGNATLAWTWFNKIGNREMYMNCAPISISGGAEDDTFFNSLPQIFVANIKGECTTGNGVLDIPNPGQSVEHGEAPTAGAIGDCTGSSSGSSSDGSSGGSSSGGSETVSSAPVQSETPQPEEPYNPGGVFAPGASPSPSATPTPENGQTDFSSGGYIGTPDNSGNTDTPDDSGYIGTPGNSGNTATPDDSGNYVNPNPSYGNSDSTVSPGNSSGQCTEGRVPCPIPKVYTCIGENQFGLCDVDNCARPQDLAYGNYCRDGKILKKRSLRFAHHGRAHRKRAI